jgi:hypothetical protein
MFIKRIAAGPFLLVRCRPGAEQEEEDAYPASWVMGVGCSSGGLTARALKAVQEKVG